MIRKLLWALAALLVPAQFFRIDKTVPAVEPAMDFSRVAQPPAEVMHLLKTSCYDCHSYETRYPWYAEVAPVSWWLKNHVNEGREHLNFSEFGNLSDRDKLEAFEECAEALRAGEMPLGSYTWLHGEARLSAAQREQLATWFERHNAVGRASGPPEILRQQN